MYIHGDFLSSFIYAILYFLGANLRKTDGRAGAPSGSARDDAGRASAQ
jgi:hypothetical protein